MKSGENSQPQPVGLFRQAALRANAQRGFGTVSVIVPPGTATVLLAGCSCVTMLVIAAFLIEVPDRVRASGVLVPASSFVKMRAMRAGKVANVAVSNGDPVTAGQQLLRIDVVDTTQSGHATAVQQIRSLRREIEFLAQAADSDVRASLRRREALTVQRANLQAQLELVEREASTRAEQAALHAHRAQRLRRLSTDARVATHTAEEFEAVALQARGNAQASARQAQRIRGDLAEIDRQIREEQVVPEAIGLDHSLRREALQRDLLALELRMSSQVIAPSNGEVAGLVVRDGSFVSEGQLLMTLHDTSSPLEARLYVAAGRAGELRVGQHVNLVLDAYPRELFGVHEAIVTSVSGIALPASELAIPLPIDGAVFEVRATSTRASAASIAWRLPPGTSVHAELTRNRRNLLQWLLQRARA
ncbi:MAG: HlyD family efflux transporter periplasmic adaptor subunit [Woeseiaceae bacterium]|nr:HlyD family efflux transporter periplasmic adaptor subunit [Woeseiaceae bacterium]